MRARRLAFVLAIAIGGLVVAWWFAAPRGDVPPLAEEPRGAATSVPPTLSAAAPSAPDARDAEAASTTVEREPLTGPAAHPKSPDPVAADVALPRAVRV